MRESYQSAQKHIMHLVAFAGSEIYEGEFYDFRIDKNTVPQGKFMYQCRHDDNGDWVTPVTIEPFVLVNFCGTLITDKEIKFDESHSIYLDHCYFE